MSKNRIDNTNEKKRWRPGRNLLTFILLILIIIIIFFAIWIPSSISKAKKNGNVSVFQNHANITNISTYYDESKITRLNAGEFDKFDLTFSASEYEDVLDKTYVKGNTLTKGDKISFNVALSASSTDGIATFSQTNSDGSSTQSSYFAYAALCIAEDWIGDYANSSYIAFTPTNLTNGTNKTVSVTSTVSYPAMVKTWGPFYKTVKTPDVYLYLVYNTSRQTQEQFIIKYTYKDYMTSSTSGAIINNK